MKQLSNVPTFVTPSIEEIAAMTAAQIERPKLTERLAEIEAIIAHHGGETFPLNRFNTRIHGDSFPSTASLKAAADDLRQAGLFVRETVGAFVVTGVESNW